MIDKIFEYLSVRGASDPGFRLSILDMYKRNARVGRFLSLLGFSLVNFLYRKRQPKYFFVGGRFSELMSKLPSRDVCVIGNPKQFLYAALRGYSFRSNVDLWGKLARNIECLDENEVQGFVNIYSDRFFLRANDQAYLIVENDSLPLQRFLITAARIRGVKSYCIQHGLFQKGSPPEILDGRFADGIFVYDKVQARIFSSAGIAANKIFTVGYYNSPYIPLRMGFNGARKVCFLGQPWFKYSEQLSEKYVAIVSDLKRGIEDLGVDFVYKPHPWEKGAPYLIGLNLFDGGMADAIEGCDIFFSITSTALVECSMSGRVSIQVYDENFNCDDFSEYGYAHKIESSAVKDSSLLGELLMRNPVSISIKHGEDFVAGFLSVAK